MIRFAFALGLGWLVDARASGTASPPPPPPPAVAFDSVPASADVQRTGADGKPHPVRARLLAEHDPVAAGSTVRVGVHLTQQPGWHTYWRSPGDIGLPTEVVWTLPAGAAMGPLQFPIPQRFELDGLVSFGYDDQVLLVSELTLPADLAPGDYALAGKATWLVCQSSCIPGEAELSLPLHVTAAGTPPAQTPQAPLFAHYAAQHPAPADALDITFAVSQDVVRGNDKFDAAFFVKPKQGPLGELPKTTWPTFTPILGANWMLSADKPTEIHAQDGGVLIVLHGEAFAADPLPTAEPIGGLVQLEVDGKWIRAEVLRTLPFGAEGATVTPTPSPLLAATAAAPPAAAAPPPVADTGGMLWNLLLAFVGGLILNVMPCVLPVLTLKLYSLVEQADITPKERHTAAVAYSVGILVSFWALAASVVGARVVLGVDLGWGSQFQYPGYVAALTTLVFGFGLSLFGVYEIPAFGVATAADASGREGVVGYFFTGVFATLLATPCSAPFLGTAVAFAFSAPTLQLVAIFSSIGLGLAAPFLVIAFIPQLFAWMPRPGEWMDWFKQVLGFSLVATTIWLVDVLGAQIGPDRQTWFLVYLMCVAIAAWIYGRWGGVLSDRRQHALALAAAAATIGLAGWRFVDLSFAEAPDCDTTVERDGLSFAEEIPWQPFSAAAVDTLAGTPVFVDFTADWCVTCKVNERTVLETATVRDAMAQAGVVPLKADWTVRDPEITEWLQRFGKAGVPFYLVIPADRSRPMVALPEVVTPDLVAQAVSAAR